MLPVFVLALAASAHAAEVDVLVVGDNAQYIEAARAATDAIGPRASLVVVAPDAPAPAAWTAAPPRVVVAVGARAVRLALASTDVPVVAAMVLQESPELASARVRVVPVAVPPARQLALLKRIAPARKTVGLVIDPGHASGYAAEARRAATEAGLTLMVREVGSAADAARAFTALFGEVDAVLLVADTTVVKRETLELLARESAVRKVPVLGYSAAVMQAGLLGGYVVDPVENGAAAGQLAAALLAGRPGAPPPLTGRLVLNAKAARALDLALPPALTAPPTVVLDPR